MKQLRQKLPLLLDPGREDEITLLKQIPLGKKDTGGYDEKWLQTLVARRPQVLPIQDIELAFTPAVFVCMELPVGSNSLDVLLATPQGKLVAVECKLWRNPEAKRKVIAQAIDYGAGLQAFTYEQLQKAIRTARRDDSFSLYHHVVNESGEPEPSLTEAEFTDAVSKNLRTGRSLLLIVGDGYHEEAETMSGFLQQHAGAHFTLALVALAIYESPSTGQRLIVPSVPLQTTSIVRGIVRVDGSGVSVTAPPPTERATTLTEDEFFEGLEKAHPGTAAALRTFLDSLDDLHVEYHVRKTLVVRMIVGDAKILPFVIRPNGRVDTDYNSGGQKELLRPFFERLAAAIPGAYVKETPKTLSLKRADHNGGLLTIRDILDNRPGCRAALETLYQAMTASADDRSDGQ
jgi:hypothetical protein